MESIKNNYNRLRINKLRHRDLVSFLRTVFGGINIDSDRDRNINKLILPIYTISQVTLDSHQELIKQNLA